MLWWNIATVTGWRTSDVCALQYSCVNWETGQATIVVSKQTKAAEARVTRKGIEIVRQQRKDAARLAADHIAYMRWDSHSLPNWIICATMPASTICDLSKWDLKTHLTDAYRVCR